MDSFTWKEFFGLFIHLAGFVIGLGAVTVIDLHGFLGRKSPYWTEATTRTHKVAAVQGDYHLPGEHLRGVGKVKAIFF